MLIQDGTAPGSKMKKRLGELLLELALITQEQLDEVLEAQKTEKRRIGALLVEKQILTSTKLTQVLSYQFNLPFVSLAQVRYTPELVERIPGSFAKQRRVVPICVSGGDVLFAATDDPADESLALALEKQTGMEVRLMVASPDEVQSVLQQHYQNLPSEHPPPPPRPVPTGAVRAAVSERPPPMTPAEMIELTGMDLEVIDGQKERGPVALCVGGGSRFVSLCVEAANAQGLRVEHASPIEAVRRASELRPAVLVVLEDVFAPHRLMLTELSISCGAHLVIWSDTLEPRYLEGLFAAVPGSTGNPRP